MPALKGAFINLKAGLLGELPDIIVFQFNPDRVTRTPSLPRVPPPNDGSGTVDARQQPGLPGETMSFSLRVDATDLLTGGPAAAAAHIAAARGILPILSALELLMIPKSKPAADVAAASPGPKSHVHPPVRLPTVLFFWGPFRVLPIAITSLSITETEYDLKLNPVRAEVSVSLQVLTPTQLAKDAAFARGAYRYTLGVKEVMAALNLVNAAQIGLSNPLSFLP